MCEKIKSSPAVPTLCAALRYSPTDRIEFGYASMHKDISARALKLYYGTIFRAVS
jgi:hypothetical protein